MHKFFCLKVPINSLEVTNNQFYQTVIEINKNKNCISIYLQFYATLFSIFQAISFLALILLICKLYDVDREIHFLQYVSNEWLSPATLNRELLHNTGPLGPAITNAHQPQVQALTSAGSSLFPVNLYSAFNTSTHQQHYALPLVINASPSASHQNKIIKPSLVTSHHQPQHPVAQPQSQPQLLSHHHAGHIADPSLQNIIFLVESLREDIDILISKKNCQFHNIFF